MNDIEKKKILRLLSKKHNFENLSVAQLHNYLSSNNIDISLPTIKNYKSLLINKKKAHDADIGFKTDSYEPFINEIVEELSRNRRKVAERKNYRFYIVKELKKYENDAILLKNQNNISKQNKRLEEIRNIIKKEICLKFNEILPKTLNYLYNDEAKKSGLLPKRSTVSPEFISQIENLFKDGTLKKYILDRHSSTKSIVEIIQDYIEDNYKMKISLSIIQRYFHKYFESLMLDFKYKNL